MVLLGELILMSVASKRSPDDHGGPINRSHHRTRVELKEMMEDVMDEDYKEG